MSTIFAPDYSAAVLATKMCTTSDDHSMYTRFLYVSHSLIFLLLKGRLHWRDFAGDFALSLHI